MLDYPGKRKLPTIILFPKKLRMFFIVSHFRFFFLISHLKFKDFDMTFHSLKRPCASILITTGMTCLLLHRSVFDAEPLLTLSLLLLPLPEEKFIKFTSWVSLAYCVMFCCVKVHWNLTWIDTLKTSSAMNFLTSFSRIPKYVKCASILLEKTLSFLIEVKLEILCYCISCCASYKLFKLLTRCYCRKSQESRPEKS